MAHAIIGKMAAGLSAREATEQALKDMTKRLNNTAGVFFMNGLKYFILKCL